MNTNFKNFALVLLFGLVSLFAAAQPDDEPVDGARRALEEPVRLFLQANQRAGREAEKGVHGLAADVHGGEAGRRQHGLRVLRIVINQRSDEVAFTGAGAADHEYDGRAVGECLLRFGNGGIGCFWENGHLARYIECFGRSSKRAVETGS